MVWNQVLQRSQHNPLSSTSKAHKGQTTCSGKSLGEVKGAGVGSAVCWFILDRALEETLGLG